MFSVKRLRMAINLLIYLSVFLGLLLILQIYGVVSEGLFYSILIGWITYFILAVLTFMNKGFVYPIVLVLATLTLMVSLPQTTHYTFIIKGNILASITFLAGSSFQIVLLILIPLYLKRRKGGKLTN
ncbi:MAG: hypothetical protein QXX95_03735 [Nitrososphaerales archaeon]